MTQSNQLKEALVKLDEARELVAKLEGQAKFHKGQAVLVRDCDEWDWKGRYFQEYNADPDYPYRTFANGIINSKNTIGWRQCKAHPDFPFND